jgi:superfamily II DNA or RNA helicase/HKD family nuclease
MGKLESDDNRLPVGVYESLLTDELLKRIAAIPENQVISKTIDVVESPGVLGKYLGLTVEHFMTGMSTEKQLDFANQILDIINTPGIALPGSAPEQILEILGSQDAQTSPRPASGLTATALLTNARDEPSLGSELRAEMATSDEVNLLSAFIRWQGLRVIEKSLTDLKNRGVRLRVLTTTYIGATERRALDELVNRFGAEVKVNYETNSTRLHAKAWLFKRASGLHTAYVGSSNLSHAALIEGLEWNVRVTESSTPSLLRKFESTFESYWNDDSFETYDPERDGERLDVALGRSSAYESTDETVDLSGFEVRPYAHQHEMLEALTAERQIHDRHRNLLIAATGTGKTVVAALDYVQLFEQLGTYPSILFVAHRKEILEQSRRTYATVLMDGEFGELLVDGSKPTFGKHVFASIQSLNEKTLSTMKPNQFDVIVIDEFHHAEAPTYRRILDHFTPKELLGLTATPERADGVDVREAFFGGRSAFELRLWNALEADLLVPFHYFGINDDLDLTDVMWKRGAGYDVSELTAKYTGEQGTSRVGKILRALQDKVQNTKEMRALGFCVSVEHAKYMAEAFNLAKIRSAVVTGATPSVQRKTFLTQLRRGELNCIFTVDVFNEGLDIPQIDTVLMLRPTQSSTIFLQQLGRGLRRAPRKSVLTVLDFIGFHRAEFRFDKILMAMTGLGRARLIQDVESGFPFLPPGTQIILDRVVQESVLRNIKNQLTLSEKDLITDVRQHLEGLSDIELADYLQRSGRSLKEIYGKSTWTSIRESLSLAAAPTPIESPFRILLKRKARNLTHVDDPDRAAGYIQAVSPDGVWAESMTEQEATYSRMLLALFFPDRVFEDLNEGLRLLRCDPESSFEVRSMLEISLDSARRLSNNLEGPLANNPLRSHARYRREEILAALEYGKVAGHQSGVAWCPRTKTDALLVTLHKSSERFSPTTMYHDYALTPTLFNWESQNATSSSSPTGIRYVNHTELGSNVVLFTRQSNLDDDGFTGTFDCLGNAEYVSHSGDRPMSIKWRLTRGMPSDVFSLASTVAR